MQLSTIDSVCRRYIEHSKQSLLSMEMQKKAVIDSHGYHAKEKIIALRNKDIYGFLYNLANEQYLYIVILYLNGTISGQQYSTVIDSIQDIIMISDINSVFGEHVIDELVCSLLRGELHTSQESFNDFFLNINNSQQCLPKQSTSFWKRLIQYFRKMSTVLQRIRKKLLSSIGVN